MYRTCTHTHSRAHSRTCTHSRTRTHTHIHNIHTYIHNIDKTHTNCSTHYTLDNTQPYAYINILSTLWFVTVLKADDKSIKQSSHQVTYDLPSNSLPDNHGCSPVTFSITLSCYSSPMFSNSCYCNDYYGFAASCELPHLTTESYDTPYADGTS